MGLLQSLGLSLPTAVAGSAAVPSAGPRDAARSGAKKAAPAPKPNPAPGYKELSWARPAASFSATPVHVASIFFATKQSVLSSQDEALLKGLAKAYSGYARRGLFNKGEVGLAGSVVGHADPRRSHEPDNVKLAQQRAAIVARRLLANLAAESGVIEGRFDIAFEGAPVPKTVEEDVPSESDAYAPMRRADVFLAGGPTEEPPAPPTPAPDEEEKPPPMKDLEQDWNKTFDRALDRADREEIRVMAIRMYGALGIGVTARGPMGGNMSADGAVAAVWTAIGLKIDFHHRDRRAQLPNDLKPTKPSWWDGIDIGTKPMGRGGRRNVLQDKARRLMAWYLTTIRFSATYIEGPGGAPQMAFQEIEKDHPDEAKMWAYARTTEQYLYMVQETVDLSKEVMKMAESE